MCYLYIMQLYTTRNLTFNSCLFECFPFELNIRVVSILHKYIKTMPPGIYAKGVSHNYKNCNCQKPEKELRLDMCERVLSEIYVKTPEYSTPLSQSVSCSLRLKVGKVCLMFAFDFPGQSVNSQVSFYKGKMEKSVFL